LNKSIEKIVSKLIKKYKTNDPIELADCLHCTVILKELDPSVRGFYQYFQRNKIMYINNSLSEHEQKIVCAHELGHAILHTKLNILFLESNTHFIKSRYEIEANTFAAELLINNAVLQKYQNLTLDQVAAAENLPIDLLKLKLKII